MSTAFVYIAWGVFFLAVAADVYLMGFAGLPSVSERVWELCADSRTRCVIGILASISYSWVVRRSWPTVVMVMLVSGHLFWHW